MFHFFLGVSLSKDSDVCSIDIEFTALRLGDFDTTAVVTKVGWIMPKQPMLSFPDVRGLVVLKVGWIMSIYNKCLVSSTDTWLGGTQSGLNHVYTTNA